VETKLLTEINRVLMNFPQYWNGEILIKNKVIEDLRDYKKDLIEALLSNELIKETYSLNLNNGVIFKIEEFISMLRYKNYWDNSYTKFSNEIGLTSDNKYLKYNTDIILDFPHKDCVLEGGMSKDEQKKDEIYYHKIIAKDEIDVLLSPKVLTKAKRYTSNGEETDILFEETDNLVIKGNNLIAISSLKERFAKNIDLIYIDPPYNVKSSNNTFLYNNRFNRSTWLVFMQNRLLIAKELLKEDGALIIAIDENEQAYLGVLIDEIFPEYEKHLITIVHNPRGVQGTNFSYTNEFAYFIIPRGKKTIINRQLAPEEIDWSPLRNWGSESLREDAKNCFYPIIVKNGEIVGFGEVVPDDVHPEKNEVVGEYIYVYPIDNQGVERKWRYARQSVEEIRTMLRCVERNGVYDIQIGKTFGQYKTVWQDSRYDANVHGKQLLNKLVPDNPFTFPKSVYTVYDCLYAVVGNKPEAKVLDFFAGSGTTAHATMLLNENDGGKRQFILVEQMGYVENVIVNRLKTLIQSEEYFAAKDYSFVYAELFALNQQYIPRIQQAESDNEIEEIIKEIKDSAFLDYKINIERLTKEDSEFASLSLGDKKKLLIESLDANQMYLSYSEIDDTQYEILESVKQFNHSFYNNSKAVNIHEQ